MNTVVTIVSLLSISSILCEPQRLNKDGCGSSEKICVLLPPSCDPETAGECDSAVTITRSLVEGSFDIKMQRRAISSPYYIALGFSDDMNMGNDTVTYCINNPALSSNQAIYGLASNQGYSNVILPSSPDVQLVQSGVIDADFVCHLSVSLLLSDPYHLLVATGLASAENMGQGEGGGEGSGRGNVLWSIIWFLILIFISLWIAGICAEFYILCYCFAACIDACNPPADMLLKGVQFPHYCAKNMMSGSPLM